MHNMAIDYLTDNAQAGGTQIIAFPAGRIALHPTIGWQIFSWAVVSPTLPAERQAGAARFLVQELARLGRRPSLVVPDSASELTQAAEELGLKPHEEHFVYFCEAPRQAACSDAGTGNGLVTVEPAADPRAWLELLCEGFEIPPEGRDPFRAAHAHIFAGDPRATLVEARVDDQRAGAAILWLTNGIAGLNTATVIPEYRRRGVHSALFAVRILRGRELGARWYATETAEPAVERVAARWGFERALSYRYWF